MLDRLLIIRTRCAIDDRDVAELRDVLIERGITLCDEFREDAVFAAALRDVLNSSERVIRLRTHRLLRRVAIALAEKQHERLGVDVVKPIEERGEELVLLSARELLGVDEKGLRGLGNDSASAAPPLSS